MYTPEYTYLAQILLAMALGSIIGWQRERWGKPAGPRTHALVVAGSALFTILSIHAFGESEAARVASNIVVGIGFLGAGLIFHRDDKKDDRVHGLTTAAGLWAAAGIGMAVGTGYYILAVGSTILMLLLLTLDDSRFKKHHEE